MTKLNEPAKPASEKEIHRLRFDKESGRWCIGDLELHGGERFSLFTDDRSEPPIRVTIGNGKDGWQLVSKFGVIKPSTRRAAL